MTRDFTPTTNNHVYLLIDAAQYTAVWRVLQYRFRRLPWLSLFEDTTDTTAVLSGPVLIQVETNQTKTIAWFLDHTQDINGLSWITSPLSLVALRGHLSGLMQVDVADDTEWAMRIFDTRILPVWFEVLNTEQRRHAFSPIVSWSFLNRKGMESTLKGMGLSVAPPPHNLKLNPSQEIALLDAALPDVVMQQLKNAANPDLRAMPYSQRYDFIADQIDKAKSQYRIHALPEIILFCTLALSIGENFDQLESVAQVLQNFPAQNNPVYADQCVAAGMLHASVIHSSVSSQPA